MKQNITKEQWDELNDEEKAIWAKFYHSKNNYSDTDNNLVNITPYPIIGEMIGYLGDDLCKKDEYNLAWWKPEELCNILWLAVKYKIKKS